MGTFMRGRVGILRASAGRSILRRFSASERPAAGHRAGRSRAIPSQGSRSKGSSYGHKQKKIGDLCQDFDPRPTRRGHGAKRTRPGPIGASAADRDPGRDYTHILFDIMTRHFGATPLRRRGSAAAGAVPGRHLRAPSGQRSTGGGRRVKAHAPGRGMAPFCRHLTIPGCPDAYRRWSTRSNPRMMRGAPPIRTAACARRPLRARLDRGSICVATL